MTSEGSKQVLREIINIWKTKSNANPAYIIYLLEKLYTILEDVYSVSSVTEIQAAIDNIGDGAGTIFIEAGTHVIDTPILINTGGSLVIYGHGDNTILEATDGTTVFNVSDCSSLLIKTLKIDVQNYTILNLNDPAILINDASNNVVGLSDVTILGDGNYGIGIEIQSDNCLIANSSITYLKTGIYVNNSDHHGITQNTISNCADYGIELETSDYNIITANMCSSNGDYGIYINTGNYNTITSNICNTNKTGIYCDTGTYNTISSNSCEQNTQNGIYLTNSSYNTISSNDLSNNDSNSLLNTAGLYVTSNSDYNTISANSLNNNNNLGIGNGYGVLINAATCNENVVSSNNANGNDIDYEDEGTGTEIIYHVQTTDEIQDAIDSIGSGTGTVIITSGSISITSTIDIDGGGFYTIKGQGKNTSLIPTTNNHVFSISNNSVCFIEELTFYDSGDLLFYPKSFIYVESTGKLKINNADFKGESFNKAPCAIYLTSSYNEIYSCYAENCRYLVYSNAGNYNSIHDNIYTDGNLNGAGLLFESTTIVGNSIKNNIITNSRNGIVASPIGSIIIDGNIIDTMLYNGIIVQGFDPTTLSYNSLIINNFLSNIGTAGSGTGINFDYTKRTLISNNIITDSSNIIGLQSTSSQDNQISNNLIYDVKTGIYFYRTLSDTVINNNINTCSEYGIYLMNGSNYNIITNNIIQSCTLYGIYANPAVSYSNYNQIKTNSFVSNSYNIYDGGVSNEVEYICSSAQEIQDAINSIGSKTGIIELSAGTITISTTIDFAGGGTYSVLGKGENTIITTSLDSTTAFSISNGSLYLSKVKFNRATNTGAGYNAMIEVITSGWLQIRDCFFTNTGVTLRYPEISLETSYNEVRNCSFDSPAREAVYVYDTDLNKITDNIIDSSGTIAISLYGDSNIIDSNEISNNTITNGPTAISATKTTGTVISNNVINTMTSSGIEISNCSHIKINDNSLTKIDIYGIQVISNSSYASISNNIISGNSADTGIVFVLSEFVSIINNKIDDFDSGILLNGCDRSDLSNNSIYDCTNYGIYLVEDNISCAINSNVIYNCTIYGIYIDNSGVVNSDNIINGNVFNANGTDLQDNGTDTIIYADNTAYGASWNGNVGTATKNTIYDKIETIVTDLDGFPDELKNLTTAEIQQLENINTETILNAQWAYLGSMSAQPLENLVEDLTPQLGGDLDCQTFDITNVGTVDGKDVSTLIANIVEDTTPQLGGDLDLNGHAIDFPTTPNISDCLDEDTMVSDSSTSLATQQSIKAYTDGKVSDNVYGAGWNGVTTIAPSKNAVYDWIVSQHFKEISAHSVYAVSGDTAGANNCYMWYGMLSFGTNCYDSYSSYARITYRLPDAYVAGEPVTLLLHWYIGGAAGNGATVDYRVRIFRASDGEAYVEEQNSTGQWTGPGNANGEENHESLTLDPTNFLAGDSITLILYMQDAAEGSVTYVPFTALKVTVNERD